MPIYEYTCECSNEVMMVQQMGAEAPICLECGGVMLRKFGSIAMFKMKGMGGYPSLRKAVQGSRYDRSDPKRWV